MVPFNGRVMRIDRCVCEAKTFGELLDTARRNALDLEELAAREGCGTHCGLCVAYLRRTLETGQTVFREILPKESLTDRTVRDEL